MTIVMNKYIVYTFLILTNQITINKHGPELAHKVQVVVESEWEIITMLMFPQRQQLSWCTKKENQIANMK